VGLGDHGVENVPPGVDGVPRAGLPGMKEGWGYPGEHALCCLGPLHALRRLRVLGLSLGVFRGHTRGVGPCSTVPV